jgi:hypothetical protein
MVRVPVSVVVWVVGAAASVERGGGGRNQGAVLYAAEGTIRDKSCVCCNGTNKAERTIQAIQAIADENVGACLPSLLCTWLSTWADRGIQW